ncbi:hypothetical protein [Photobacterium damselae]|uniref:hypothetical protein n=1 Tax=Photobacterium damselae TaxID=38293 RepID=UPI0040697654
MSFVKRLEFGNYTLKFGEKKVLLDMFDEIVMPSFWEMKYVRKLGDSSEYFFLDTELITLDDNVEEPVLGITGRIVKNTKLKRDQIFKEKNLSMIKMKWNQHPVQHSFSFLTTID